MDAWKPELRTPGNWKNKHADAQNYRADDGRKKMKK
jgi:hypothetical protein